MNASVKDLAGPIGVQLRSNQHARVVHADRQHLVQIGADMGDAVSVCCGRMGLLYGAALDVFSQAIS